MTLLTALSVTALGALGSLGAWTVNGLERWHRYGLLVAVQLFVLTATIGAMQ